MTPPTKERWCFFLRQSRYTQIRVVREKDPGQFQEAFNQAQVELQSKRPETVKIKITDDGMVAVIEYEVDVEVPETAEDELRVQGLCFTCENCPKFNPATNLDGSVKQTSKKYLKGEIQPVGGSK